MFLEDRAGTRNVYSKREIHKQAYIATLFADAQVLSV